MKKFTLQQARILQDGIQSGDVDVEDIVILMEAPAVWLTESESNTAVRLRTWENHEKAHVMLEAMDGEELLNFAHELLRMISVAAPKAADTIVKDMLMKHGYTPIERDGGAVRVPRRDA